MDQPYELKFDRGCHINYSNGFILFIYKAHVFKSTGDLT